MTSDDVKRPPFVFPEIWKDDDVIYSMMQPIRRPKHVDPQAYNSKVNFWKNIIKSYVNDQRVVVVNGRSLQSVFSRYFVEEGSHLSPQCLGEVLYELVSEDSIRPYQSSGLIKTIIDTGIEYIVKRPFYWVLGSSSTSSSDRNVINMDESFVFHQLADKLAEEFIVWFRDNLMSQRISASVPIFLLESFDSALSSFIEHEDSREYIRTLLMSKYRSVRIDHVRASNETDPIPVVCVSERLNDRVPNLTKIGSQELEPSTIAGLAHVKRTILRLETEEANLEAVILERRSQIKALLLGKRMTEAKNLLRRTKPLEKALEQKQIQLQNLESMQLQIESATDNKSILHVLDKANKALQRTTGGFEGISKAEETMNEVFDSIHEQQEVANSIASFGTLTTDLATADELEDELKDLLAESPGKMTTDTKPVDDLEKELERLNVVDLPDLPSRPSKSPIKSPSSSSVLRS